MEKAKSMNINETAQKCHEISRSKGWYEKGRTSLEFHMLMVSEIAEATECVRNNEPPIWAKCEEDIETSPQAIRAMGLNPEGEAIELADLAIRLFDYCVHRGFDLEAAIEMKMDYNKTRPHRHGGKAL